MTKYLFKRIMLAAISLLLLIVIVFFLMKMMPGQPIKQGNNQSYENYLAQLEQLGLLDSPIEQFLVFFKELFTEGTFGVNYKNPAQDVTSTLLGPMESSLFISIPSFVLSILFGIGLGILSAYYRGRIFDTIITIFVVIFNAMPSFVLAIYFLKLGGVLDLPTQFVPFVGNNLGDTLYSIIIPVLAMTLTSLTAITVYTRNELVEVFKQDYIKTALSKGLSFRQVLFKHALRNAGIPILSIVLPSLITVLSGSIIIERFFVVPGAANVLVNAIQEKETFVVLFGVTFYGIIYFVLQIVMDITYSFVDPRIVLATKNDASWFEKTKKFAIRQKAKTSFKDYSGISIDLTREGE